VLFYGERLREAAAKLGDPERTVRRLVKKWEQEGLVGLTPDGTGRVKRRSAELMRIGSSSS